MKENTKRVIRYKGALKKGGGITTSALSLIKKGLSKIPFGAVVNTAIDALPVELHLPGGYQYCGPGTKLKERLLRGDPGINKLDQACKEHDIAYSKYKDTANRTVADRLLADKAWKRVKSIDASVGERAAALSVVAAMKAKTAVGGGKRRIRRRHNRGKKGGNIKKRQQNKKKQQRKKTTLWSMSKSGRGLYLRPYRNVY